ncbi:hypothetical protein Ddye_017934 [Dipteronia dyeriana]|uniref:RNase H type-1 domain-containing protein n=1 Tax=Dipteronia dyeriana TaxID=168575 RepID=A0AAD9X1T9_9ROSI|nr:hypothetical protein Ddye_017934 [Dipteronia dyeriana]
MVARWRPPRAGFYKINCGVVNEVGGSRVGIGIVIRNDSGLVMVSCSQVIEDNFDGQIARTMAVYRGILFSQDCGLEPCVIESDKVRVVDHILNVNPLDTKCGTILIEMAQGLANHALKITGDAFWTKDILSCLRSTTEADMPT